MVSKAEKLRLQDQHDRLRSMGFGDLEIKALRRISQTLQRWHEYENYGFGSRTLERDGETGKPYLVSRHRKIRQSIPDREGGAKKRLAKIMGDFNMRREDIGYEPFSCFINTDPRGVALYILRPGDIPEGESVHAYYGRGIPIF